MDGMIEKVGIMSKKKRILLLVFIYMFNLAFFFACLLIDRKGMLSTLRYDGRMITINGILLLNVAFSEMCMVMHRYHCKKKTFGSVCIALDKRCMLQNVMFPAIYVLLLFLAFFDTSFGLLFFLFCFLAITVILCGNFSSFLWIAGNDKYYMSEYGEVFYVKNLEIETSRSVITYEDYKGKVCRVKVKKELTW